MNLRHLLSLTLLLVWGTSFAQTGKIEGKVTGSADEPLAWLEVGIEGTYYGAYTDDNGQYFIEGIEPGTYTVKVADMVSGTTTSQENVVVTAGQTTTVDLKLVETVETDQVDFAIEWEPDPVTEEAALEEKMNNDNVVEEQSSEEMKSKGASKASDAVKSISGVSIVNGKYAYIRGLSDRYSKTLLNGSEVPGMDPNRNAVALDIFPSSYISNITVVKTYTPDLPADYSGGLIDIHTQEYPDSLTIKLSLGATYNSQSSFNNNFRTFNTNPGQGGGESSVGNGMDWTVLGFNNSSQNLPTEAVNKVQDGTYPGFGFGSTQEEMVSLSKSFNKVMVPTTGLSGMDHKLNFTIGNKIALTPDSVAEQKVYGYFFGVNYRRSFSHFEDGERNIYTLNGNIDDKSELNLAQYNNLSTSKDNVLLGAYWNNVLQLNTRNRIGLNLIHNQTGSTTASYAEGQKDTELDWQMRTTLIDYTQRSLSSAQLYGKHEHYIGQDSANIGKKLEIDWIQSATLASQYQPDTRVWRDAFQETDSTRYYEVRPSAFGTPTRFSREMNEWNADSKINFSLPFTFGPDSAQKTLTMKAGLSNTMKSREYSELRFDYSIASGSYNGNDIEGSISDENMNPTSSSENPNVFIQNNTAPGNTYSATQRVTAGYLMGSYNLTPRLDFVGGARVENTDIFVESADPTKDKGDLAQTDVMPSANFIYSIWKDKAVRSKLDTNDFDYRNMKLRMSYNMTLARPTFRELAPFAADDFFLKATIVGNPNLEITKIHNLDLRWELYPRAGEIISVSAFYKHFFNPIEVRYAAKAQNREFTWENSDEAQLYGVEFEYRKKLDFITPALKNFKIGTNITLSQSLIELSPEELEKIQSIDPYREDTRSMFGQSPYLINAIAEYKNDSLGLNMNFTYNIFGERLAIVNIDGTPNIYEQPYGDLNFNLMKKFGERISVSFRAKNILNPTIKSVYKFQGDAAAYEKFEDTEYIFSSNKRGRRFSLSFGYTF